MKGNGAAFQHPPTSKAEASVYWKHNDLLKDGNLVARPSNILIEHCAKDIVLIFLVLKELVEVAAKAVLMHFIFGGKGVVLEKHAALPKINGAQIRLWLCCQPQRGPYQEELRDDCNQKAEYLTSSR